MRRGCALLSQLNSRIWGVSPIGRSRCNPSPEGVSPLNRSPLVAAIPEVAGRCVRHTTATAPKTPGVLTGAEAPALALTQNPSSSSPDELAAIVH